MRVRVLVAVLLALLGATAVAEAQRDRMSLGEGFGTVVIRGGQAPAPMAPQITVPKETLAPKETLTPVKRPPLPKPAVPKAP